MSPTLFIDDVGHLSFIRTPLTGLHLISMLVARLSQISLGIGPYLMTLGECYFGLGTFSHIICVKLCNGYVMSTCDFWQGLPDYVSAHYAFKSSFFGLFSHIAPPQVYVNVRNLSCGFTGAKHI